MNTEIKKYFAMDQKGFINIILIIAIAITVALVGAGVYFIATKQVPAPASNSSLFSATTIPTPAATDSILKSTATPASNNNNDAVLSYYIQSPENQKVGGGVGFRIVPEDKNARVYEAGHLVAFTLQKPDGSKYETKQFLNNFVMPACAAPPYGAPPSSCGVGSWVAGNGISFGNFPYYDQPGKYVVSASDERARGVSFKIKDLELGYLLIDVNGYKKSRISEVIAGGAANQESLIVATYQGDPFHEVNVDVFAEASLENAQKRFDLIAKFYPKVDFEGQKIAVFENSSSFTAVWLSGAYQLSVNTLQKSISANAREVLKAYLIKYPSSL